MPDSMSDSGDVGSANLSDSSGFVLQGYVDSYSTGVEETGLQDGVFDTSEWSGYPSLQAGVDQTVLQGGVDFTDYLDPNVLQGSILGGGGGGGLSAGADRPGSQPQQIVTQVVKADIRNTVVQPLEPCRSLPYLKLVFLPVNPDVRFRRDLRREASVPVPRPLSMTVEDFVALFAGHVHIKDIRYMLRWKQVLPVVIEPQDSGAVNYKSVDTYDLRTAIPLDDPALVDELDFSQLPLIQVTKAEDITGGTLDPELDDYELYLDQVIFADIDQATGKLIAKDPVEAGIFTG